ncbi:HAD family phosphatase [Paenibacillaceae bacterium]|nr:HAD family phosphatase [Paenibacillaceae bacterium]
MKFVFDLDGTICFQGQPVSETILTALEQLKLSGHEVIFASARPIRDLLPVIHERFHNYSLVGGNGSLISLDGKIIRAESFAAEQIAAIMQLIEAHQATYLIDSDWDYAYTGPSDHPILRNVDPSKRAKKVEVDTLQSIVKILIVTASDIEALAEQIALTGAVIHRHRHENIIDISPQNIHKWNALLQLGLQEKQFVAFGNDANDITMFQHAQHTVMIGHHIDLAPYADEAIPLEGNYEEQIAGKLRELAVRPFLTKHPL